MTAVIARAADRTPPRWQPGSPATVFRAVLLVLCSALSALADQRTYAALPIALLAVLALANERSAVLARRQLSAAMAEAFLVGAAVSLTGGARSPMLPYLLAPGLAIGLTGAWRHVALSSAASTLGLAAGRLGYALGLPRVRYLPGDAFAVGVGLWVLLGLAFGLVAAWAQRLALAAHPTALDQHEEARALLRQLRAVSRRLPGGLDLTSAALSLLDRCALVTECHRAAVLVQVAPGALVPAAVRGTGRVPWRAPLTAPGPLREAWETCRSVIDAREPDANGRRRGSCLAVLPLAAEGAPFGLVVLEAYDREAFDPLTVDRLQAVATLGALRVETALLFEEVRDAVTLEERNRLAHDIHDGLAQDLAAVGYQLDDLRLRAAKLDGGLAEAVAGLRRGLTRLISDLRLSITELRSGVGIGRGLGAALTSYLRALGSSSGLSVHVSLHESAFRLTGDAEVLLLQIAQAVAQDARRAGGAANLWVTLSVDPPSARLVVEHDSPQAATDALDLSDLANRLMAMRGSLRVRPRPDAGVHVEVILQGDDDDGDGAAGR